MVWIFDGAREFWRLYERHFASIAIGILDFYHAAQNLWESAEAYDSFKGTGMHWSEAGFNHLLYLRLAWVNGRFALLFAEHPLTLHLYSLNR